MSGDAEFHEAQAWTRPLRELALRIEGTRLEPVIEELRGELRARGITRLRPRFYLSTEWGVPYETVAVAIPFYLASDALTKLHEQRSGHVEGVDREDLLRYLRHETGHVACYAYRLHERPEWRELFGPMERPYRESWRPRPFSRRHVRHLPGWYAQKHPDEDFAETFAVWLAPGDSWRDEYADMPVVLRKLEWCDATMRELRDVDPVVTDETLDEDVSEIDATLQEIYEGKPFQRREEALRLDGALRSLFQQLPRSGGPRLSAGELARSLRPALMAEVYRWTGHFPERVGRLVDHLALRADALGLTCDAASRDRAVAALTAFVSALAMTWVARGRYEP